MSSAANNTLPSPVEGPFLHKLTDEGIATYIEFPEDVVFMESAAHNSAFKPGVALIPAQRIIDGEVQSFVYEIEPPNTSPTILLGPIVIAGSHDITIFGSALTSAGILYLCCFNRNSLLVYDLKTSKPRFLLEIPNLASPNDMCYDPNNEHKLYIAGGSFRNVCYYCSGGCTGDCCKCIFTNSARGQVFEVQVDLENANKKVVAKKVICSGLDVLAGIEVVNNKIWVAQLYDVFTIDQDDYKKVRTVWSGNDGQGQVWLADNMDVLVTDTDDDSPSASYLFYPAYSATSESQADVMATQTCLTSTYFMYLQLMTAFLRGEGIREALLDPEVALSLNNTYIDEDNPDDAPPPPVRVVLQNSGNVQKAHHFEIDLRETRQNHEPRTIKDPRTGEVLGKRHYFNEQVTHTSHLLSSDGKEGYLLCVNFEQPRILLLKDEPFKKILAADA